MRRLLKYLFALMIVAGVGWLTWHQLRENAVAVSVAVVERGRVEATIANTRAGTVRACQRALLSPSLGGQIKILPFAEGEPVKKDDVLLEIWNDDIRADIILTAQQLVASQDEKIAVCQQAEEALRQADRIRQLARSRSVSAATIDEAQAAERIGKARCDAAQAQESVARSRLELVKTHLKKTILLAPFDGVVARVNGELNEYVTPSPPGIQTPPVIDLIAPGCFTMDAPIDEVDAPRVSVGQPARITLDAWREREFAGEVKRIGAYIVDSEKQARTVEVELTFSHKPDIADLRAGYSADVDIILESKPDTLRIPTETLVDADHVLRYDPSTQRLQRQKVETGIGNWTYTEILGGLSEGDMIVTSLGVEGVAPGALATVSAE